jgi:hypothetical protein
LRSVYSLVCLLSEYDASIPPTLDFGTFPLSEDQKRQRDTNQRSLESRSGDRRSLHWENVLAENIICFLSLGSALSALVLI